MLLTQQEARTSASKWGLPSQARAFIVGVRTVPTWVAVSVQGHGLGAPGILGERQVLFPGQDCGWRGGSCLGSQSLGHLLGVGERSRQGDMILDGRRGASEWWGMFTPPAGQARPGGLPAVSPARWPHPGAPTALKTMLSKPGATAAVSAREGQLLLFCNQRHPPSPISTRTMSTRRALPTTVGTEAASAVSPVGRGHVSPGTQALPINPSPTAEDT